MADVRIQLRRDTAANWTSNDPTLASGEVGFETDTNAMKLGDGSTAWSSLDYILSPKVMFTPEGGVAIKLINRTGSNSVKGSLVSASTLVDGAFILQTNEYDTIGVVYDDGVANASECFVVVSGIAQVLFKDSESSTRGYVLLAADTDGRGYNVAVPSGNPTVDNHWKECGHVIESKTAGTNVLVKCIIHFN